MSHTSICFCCLLYILSMYLYYASSTTISTKPRKNHISHVRHCEVCALTFKNVPEYERHLAGKSHKLRLSSVPDDLREEFRLSAPHWAENCNPDDVMTPWKEEELSSLGFKYRSTCLHPGPKLSDLRGKQKARIWRYVRDAIGQGHYKELSTIIAHAETTRVKELFESIESFKFVSNFIITAQRTLKESGCPPLVKICELACGHGLVGILLAYRFPHMQVSLYDIQRRPLFDSYLESWGKFGHTLDPNEKDPLCNLKFYEKDIKCAEGEGSINDCVVVCLHGCNEVNEIAVDMTLRGTNSVWCAMPCCIAKDLYSTTTINVEEDNMRYVFLFYVFYFIF